jgi:choline dehydrogenase
MVLNSALTLLVAIFGVVHSLYLNARNINDALLECYDYIVVGGGISGMVVANRLTEDPNGKVCFTVDGAGSLK